MAPIRKRHSRPGLGGTARQGLALPTVAVRRVLEELVAYGLATQSDVPWVISEHLQCKKPCPLCPRKRTSFDSVGISAKAKSGHRRYPAGAFCPFNQVLMIVVCLVLSLVCETVAFVGHT